MAAFTENAMKLAGIAAALPFVAVAAGFRLRFAQAEETSGSGVRRVYRVCDLPMYSVADRRDLKCDGDIPYPRNSLEAGIRVVRKAVQGLLGNFAHAVDNSVKMTARTSVTTSVATYKYVRDNTEDISRAAIVAGAGIGGFLLKHHSNPWRRVSYGFLAAVPCAMVFYPSKLLQLCQPASNFVREACERNLWKQVVQKYYRGEQSRISKASAVYTGENFDTISLSDFNEPDVEKLRTVDLCHADNVEKLNTNEVCHPESFENVSAIDCCQSENVDKLATGYFCTGKHVAMDGTTGIGNAEHVAQPDSIDCTRAENIDKATGVDASNAENVGGLDKFACRREENIAKPISLDVRNCKAENVGKLSTVNYRAASKEKLWIVDNCNWKKTEKKAKGSTDQSLPEDKDMYSTRSS